MTKTNDAPPIPVPSAAEIEKALKKMDFYLAASAEEKAERVNRRNIGGKNKASHCYEIQHDLPVTEDKTGKGIPTHRMSIVRVPIHQHSNVTTDEVKNTTENKSAGERTITLWQFTKADIRFQWKEKKS